MKLKKTMAVHAALENEQTGLKATIDIDEVGITLGVPGETMFFSHDEFERLVKLQRSYWIMRQAEGKEDAA